MLSKQKNVQTFIGCDADFNSSDIVIFGAGFDGTTTYRPGARFAPSRIRAESYSIETYSPYQDKDLSDLAVFDGGDLELPYGNTRSALTAIERSAAKVLNSGKFPLMIGGEHLVTLGAFRAVYEKHPDVCVVHFDAHCDLRDDYLGEKLSHSTVIRRIYDTMSDGTVRIFQFGIRSGERAEFEFADKYTCITKFNFEGIAKKVAAIGSRPVYLTVDLDVLDPAEFPGTGTPEAGGVNFADLLNAVREVCKLNVVAADVTELSPPYDASGASTALACKFVRELLLALPAKK